MYSIYEGGLKNSRKRKKILEQTRKKRKNVIGEIHGIANGTFCLGLYSLHCRLLLASIAPGT